METLPVTEILIWGVVYFLALAHGWRMARRPDPDYAGGRWIDPEPVQAIPAIVFGGLLGFNAARYLVQLVPEGQWLLAGPALGLYGLYLLQQAASNLPPEIPTTSGTEQTMNQWACSMLLGALLYVVGLHQFNQLAEPCILAVLACGLCAPTAVPAWLKRGPGSWARPVSGALLSGLGAGAFVEHATDGQVNAAPTNVAVTGVLLAAVLLPRVLRSQTDREPRGG
jgi:hypothetical protein